MPKWTKHLIVWMLLALSILIQSRPSRALDAAPDAAAPGPGPFYLIALYYERLPDGTVVPFAPDGLDERLIWDRFRTGDSYCLPVPELPGYRFCGEGSSPLSGTFAADDIRLTLCFTKVVKSAYTRFYRSPPPICETDL